MVMRRSPLGISVFVLCANLYGWQYINVPIRISTALRGLIENLYGSAAGIVSHICAYL